jgi:iron complex outermembrane receptor protein
MKSSLNKSGLAAACLFSSVCLSGVAPVHASEGAVSEQDYLQDLPVVLSASRLHQPLSEAPNAVTVIDREMIKASGFRNLADVFRLVPGMFVDNYDGHTPIVAYHGSGDEFSRRMQVLVDGRSVYLPPFSNVVWGDIPLQIDDIERIEVVRGPAAASHGANSFQGVINIITRDASSVHGATVSITKGDGGVSDIAAHLGKTGAELDYRFTLGYRADNGLDTNVVNDNTVTRQANLRANYHPNGSDSIDFQLGYNEGVWGLGVGAGRKSDPFRDTRVHSNFEQLAWLHVRPQGDEIKLQYYHLYRHLTDPGGLAPAFGATLIPPDHTVVHRHDVELQHTVQLGANNRLVWGGGMRTDSADSTLSLKIPQEMEQSRLFAHDEWRINQAALLNVGAMFEKDGYGHENISPRVSFNYHLAPQHTVRIGTSVAYRSPALVEEKGNTPGEFSARGGLRPEKMYSREIGYLGEFNNLGLTADARVFYDKISDIIYLDPLGLLKPYSFRNLAGASEQGFETTIKYRWQDRNSLIFNYARLSVDCTITGTLTNVALLPPAQGAQLQGLLQSLVNTCAANGVWSGGSILLTQQLRDDVQFSAGYYHQSPLQIMNSSEATVMRRMDMRIAKSLGKSAMHSGGEIAFVVQNAFQSGYAEYSTIPQTNFIKLFNRRAYLTATLNF